MERYLFTIGGTGAKCLEALVYMGAMGIFKDDVYILHIDPDKDNGNWLTASKALESYNNVKALITQKFNIFSTTFNPFRQGQAKKVDFCPLPRKTDTSNYASFSDYAEHSLVGALLFSEKIRNDRWGIGFKGRASLGSVVSASAIKSDKEPWNTISQQILNTINSGGEVRIFLIGSIFGGSGASIFPTIGKLFSNEFKTNDNFKIGGALLFPYFTYTVPSDANKEDFAKPTNFLPKSRLHLEFYESLTTLNPFKRVYILGDKRKRSVLCEKGSSDQLNPPHHVEFLSIILAKDFFNTNGKDLDQLEYMGIYRDNNEEKEGLVKWNHIPDNANAEKKFLTFTTMALSFLGFWEPLLRESKFKETRWFKTYIGDAPQLDDKLNNLKKLFNNYIRWLLGVHIGDQTDSNLKECQINQKIQLFSARIFQDILPDNQNDEIRITEKESKEIGESLNVLKWRGAKGSSDYYEPKIKMEKSYDFLWKLACSLEINNEYSPVERLINIIEKTSNQFVNENYSS